MRANIENQRLRTQLEVFRTQLEQQQASQTRLQEREIRVLSLESNVEELLYKQQQSQYEITNLKNVLFDH